MDQNFSIFYADGVSQRPRTGQLRLGSAAFEIDVFGDDDRTVERTVRWPLAGIRRNETASGNSVFRFGQRPEQTLECRDPRFPRALKKAYPDAPFLERGLWLSENLGKIALLAFGLLVAACAWLFVYFLPKAAEKLAEKVPIELEKKLGEAVVESMTKSERVDSSRSVLLQKFADEIDFGTDYELRFTVIQKDEMNAFAAPGGQIFVFSHLLEKCETPEALVGLLGHEAGHIERRHSLRGMSRQVSSYLLMAAILGDASGLGHVLIDNADGLLQLSYGRDLEREADEMAQKTLDRNRLDRRGLVELFEILGSEGGAEAASAMSFLRSHPLTEERLETAKKWAAEQPAAVEKNERLEAVFRELNL